MEPGSPGRASGRARKAVISRVTSALVAVHVYNRFTDEPVVGAGVCIAVVAPAVESLQASDPASRPPTWAKNSGSGFCGNTVTDEAGWSHSEVLAPHTYVVTCTCTGFQPFGTQDDEQVFVTLAAGSETIRALGLVPSTTGSMITIRMLHPARPLGRQAHVAAATGQRITLVDGLDREGDLQRPAFFAVPMRVEPGGLLLEAQHPEQRFAVGTDGDGHCFFYGTEAPSSAAVAPSTGPRGPLGVVTQAWGSPDTSFSSDFGDGPELGLNASARLLGKLALPPPPPAPVAPITTEWLEPFRLPYHMHNHVGVGRFRVSMASAGLQIVAVATGVTDAMPTVDSRALLLVTNLEDGHAPLEIHSAPVPALGKNANRYMYTAGDVAGPTIFTDNTARSFVATGGARSHSCAQFYVRQRPWVDIQVYDAAFPDREVGHQYGFEYTVSRRRPSKEPTAEDMTLLSRGKLGARGAEVSYMSPGYEYLVAVDVCSPYANFTLRLQQLASWDQEPFIFSIPSRKLVDVTITVLEEAPGSPPLPGMSLVIKWAPAEDRSAKRNGTAPGPGGVRSSSSMSMTGADGVEALTPGRPLPQRLWLTTDSAGQAVLSLPGGSALKIRVDVLPGQYEPHSAVCTARLTHAPQQAVTMLLQGIAGPLMQASTIPQPSPPFSLRIKVTSASKERSHGSPTVSPRFISSSDNGALRPTLGSPRGGTTDLDAYSSGGSSPSWTPRQSQGDLSHRGFTDAMVRVYDATTCEQVYGAAFSVSFRRKERTLLQVSTAGLLVAGTTTNNADTHDNGFITSGAVTTILEMDAKHTRADAEATKRWSGHQERHNALQRRYADLEKESRSSAAELRLSMAALKDGLDDLVARRDADDDLETSAQKRSLRERFELWKKKLEHFMVDVGNSREKTEERLRFSAEHAERKFTEMRTSITALKNTIKTELEDAQETTASSLAASADKLQGTVLAEHQHFMDLIAEQKQALAAAMLELRAATAADDAQVVAVQAGVNASVESRISNVNTLVLEMQLLFEAHVANQERALAAMEERLRAAVQQDVTIVLDVQASVTSRVESLMEDMRSAVNEMTTEHSATLHSKVASLSSMLASEVEQLMAYLLQSHAQAQAEALQTKQRLSQAAATATIELRLIIDTAADAIREDIQKAKDDMAASAASLAREVLETRGTATALVVKLEARWVELTELADKLTKASETGGVATSDLVALRSEMQAWTQTLILSIQEQSTERGREHLASLSGVREELQVLATFRLEAQQAQAKAEASLLAFEIKLMAQEQKTSSLMSAHVSTTEHSASLEVLRLELRSNVSAAKAEVAADVASMRLLVETRMAVMETTERTATQTNTSVEVKLQEQLVALMGNFTTSLAQQHQDALASAKTELQTSMSVFSTAFHNEVKLATSTSLTSATSAIQQDLREAQDALARGGVARTVSVASSQVDLKSTVATAVLAFEKEIKSVTTTSLTATTLAIQKLLLAAQETLSQAGKSQVSVIASAQADLKSMVATTITATQKEISRVTSSAVTTATTTIQKDFKAAQVQVLQTARDLVSSMTTTSEDVKMQFSQEVVEAQGKLASSLQQAYARLETHNTTWALQLPGSAAESAAALKALRLELKVSIDEVAATVAADAVTLKQLLEARLSSTLTVNNNSSPSQAQSVEAEQILRLQAHMDTLSLTVRLLAEQVQGAMHKLQGEVQGQALIEFQLSISGQLAKQDVRIQELRDLATIKVEKNVLAVIDQKPAAPTVAPPGAVTVGIDVVATVTRSGSSGATDLELSKDPAAIVVIKLEEPDLPKAADTKTVGAVAEGGTQTLGTSFTDASVSPRPEAAVFTAAQREEVEGVLRGVLESLQQWADDGEQADNEADKMAQRLSVLRTEMEHWTQQKLVELQSSTTHREDVLVLGLRRDLELKILTELAGHVPVADHLATLAKLREALQGSVRQAVEAGEARLRLDLSVMLSDSVASNKTGPAMASLDMVGTQHQAALQEEVLLLRSEVQELRQAVQQGAGGSWQEAMRLEMRQMLAGERASMMVELKLHAGLAMGAADDDRGGSNWVLLCWSYTGTVSNMRRNPAFAAVPKDADVRITLHMAHPYVETIQRVDMTHNEWLSTEVVEFGAVRDLSADTFWQRRDSAFPDFWDVSTGALRLPLHSLARLQPEHRVPAGAELCRERVTAFELHRRASVVVRMAATVSNPLATTSAAAEAPAAAARASTPTDRGGSRITTLVQLLQHWGAHMHLGGEAVSCPFCSEGAKPPAQPPHGGWAMPASSNGGAAPPAALSRSRSMTDGGMAQALYSSQRVRALQLAAPWALQQASAGGSSGGVDAASTSGDSSGLSWCLSNGTVVHLPHAPTSRSAVLLYCEAVQLLDRTALKKEDLQRQVAGAQAPPQRRRQPVSQDASEASEASDQEAALLRSLLEHHVRVTAQLAELLGFERALGRHLVHQRGGQQPQQQQQQQQRLASSSSYSVVSLGCNSVGGGSMGGDSLASSNLARAMASRGTGGGGGGRSALSLLSRETMLSQN